MQDVVQLLTDTSDVKDYIKKMKKRDAEINSNWGTICTLVEMEAADGKNRLNNGWHRLVQTGLRKLRILNSPHNEHVNYTKLIVKYILLCVRYRNAIHQMKCYPFPDF